MKPLGEGREITADVETKATYVKDPGLLKVRSFKPGSLSNLDRSFKPGVVNWCGLAVRR